MKINAHGGIAGRPIILKSLDDEGEALRRSARSLNREALVAALESMHAYDLGGVSVSFSPAAHAGADFVDTDVIASDGRFVR